MGERKATLDDLKEIDNRIANQKMKTENEVQTSNDSVSETAYSTKPVDAKMLEKYEHLPKTDMPHEGKLYPDNWQFFYRCPTADEVSIFSTIDDNDYFKIMLANINLVRKCFIIIDENTETQISTERIKSAHKMFFFLKVRNFYMNDEPIILPTFSPELEEMVEVKFNEFSLQYTELTDQFLDMLSDDRRGILFPLDVTKEYGLDEEIYIPITDFSLEVKMINFITNSFKKMQKNETTKKDFDSFDKKFLAFAPFLFQSGSESVESLKLKFKRITENDNLMRFYLDIMNNLKLGEKENIKYCEEREGEEIWGETPMKFPNGHKGLFTRKSVMSKLFG